MIHTVVWTPSAEAVLASLWENAPSELRLEITRAADHLDKLLRRSPDRIGRPRTNRERVAIELPLGIVFEIREQDRLVVVLSVDLLPSEPFHHNQ